MPILTPARGYKIPVVITNPGAVGNVVIHPAALKPVLITAVRIEPAQAALVTDAGARVRLGRVTSAATMTAIAATAFVNLDPTLADATFTAGHTVTAGGAIGDFVERGWRSVQGFEWFPTPEEYILCPAGVAGGFGVFHNVAPPAGNYSFEITAYEIG